MTNLNVQLSETLLKKLAASATDEGLSVEALATELLAEGVTLRAWEIVERKGAMRAPEPAAPARSGNRAGGNAWMEDKAAFLEYVRNQERRGRR